MGSRRRELKLRLQAGPRAAREARAAVEGTLARARPEVRDDVQLLVSELVTNSVRHADLGPGDAVKVRLSASPEAVRVEVEDAGRGFDPARLAGPRGAGGYGLFLVDRLANRWGVDRRAGVNVWFELDRPFAEAV